MNNNQKCVISAMKVCFPRKEQLLTIIINSIEINNPSFGNFARRGYFAAPKISPNLLGSSNFEGLLQAGFAWSQQVNILLV
jgi:hypothetical protein